LQRGDCKDKRTNAAILETSFYSSPVLLGWWIHCPSKRPGSGKMKVVILTSVRWGNKQIREDQVPAIRGFWIWNETWKSIYPKSVGRESGSWGEKKSAMEVGVGGQDKTRIPALVFLWSIWEGIQRCVHITSSSCDISQRGKQVSLSSSQKGALFLEQSDAPHCFPPSQWAP
jgi:hypothetical protein